MIRASTGKAVMLMAMPINKAKDENAIVGGANSMYRKYARPTPKA